MGGWGSGSIPKAPLIKGSPVGSPSRDGAGKPSGSTGPGLLCTGCVNWGKLLLGSSGFHICERACCCRGDRDGGACAVMVMYRACMQVTFFPPLKIGEGINPAAGLETYLLCHYPALQEQTLGRREKIGSLGTPEHRVSRTAGSGVAVSSPCLSSGLSPTWTSGSHLQHSRSAVEPDTLSPTQGYLHSAPRR